MIPIQPGLKPFGQTKYDEGIDVNFSACIIDWFIVSAFNFIVVVAATVRSAYQPESAAINSQNFSTLCKKAV